MLDNFIPIGISENKMWFGRKKNDPQTLLERVNNMENDILKLKREVLSTTMDIDTIRDKVLRKIQSRKAETREEINTVLLPETA